MQKTRRCASCFLRSNKEFDDALCNLWMLLNGERPYWRKWELRALLTRIDVARLAVLIKLWKHNL